jgi:hypothetical protein
VLEINDRQYFIFADDIFTQPANSYDIFVIDYEDVAY